MLLDLVNRIRSERKVLDIQVWVLSRSSRGRPESTSQGRPLNVRLRRPLDVISGRPQNVRLGRPQDVKSRRPQDGQIGSLGDVLGTLEGDVLGTSWDQYLLAGRAFKYHLHIRKILSTQVSHWQKYWCLDSYGNQKLMQVLLILNS